MGRDVVRSTKKDSSQSIAIDGNSWGWGEMIYLSSTCFEISYIVAEIFFSLNGTYVKDSTIQGISYRCMREPPNLPFDYLLTGHDSKPSTPSKLVVYCTSIAENLLHCGISKEMPMIVVSIK